MQSRNCLLSDTKSFGKATTLSYYQSSRRGLLINSVYICYKPGHNRELRAGLALCRRGESSSVNKLTILSRDANNRDNYNSKGRSPDKNSGPIDIPPTQ